MYVMLDTANGNFFYNSPNEAKKLDDLLRKKYPKIFDNYDVKHVLGKNSKGKPAGAVVIDVDIEGLYKLSEICNCPIIISNEKVTPYIPYGALIYDGYIE